MHVGHNAALPKQGEAIQEKRVQHVRDCQRDNNVLAHCAAAILRQRQH